MVLYNYLFILGPVHFLVTVKSHLQWRSSVKVTFLNLLHQTLLHQALFHQTVIQRMWSKCSIAFCPGLPTPAFVAYNTNVGEGLVNWSCAVMYLDVAWVDVWRSGTFPEKTQASGLLIANTDHRMIDNSTSDSQLYRRNMPLLHASAQHPGMS